jgi:hypothetical protein
MGTAWEGRGGRGSPGWAVPLAASQELITLFSPQPLPSFGIDSLVGRWRRSFLMSMACVHIFLSGGAAANHVATLCTESAAISTRWAVKKGAGRGANSRCGGRCHGGLDPRLAGWGLVHNGGGSLEQLQPDEILGNLWEAVLALRIEDGIGGVLDREPMQLGDEVCKLSVLVHLGLWLGVLLFEMHCVCLILRLSSSGHVTIVVVLEPVVVLQVSVMQRVTVLPEWAWVVVFTPKEVLHPSIRVSQSGVDGVTGLITKAAL